MVEAGAALQASLNPYPLRYVRTSGGARNPRWPNLVAGASSSGSAAAVAAGLLRGALGTDTGGSIRYPALCCGVVGFKPSNGLVPMTGIEPMAWSLDVAGPITRDTKDCARLLSAISGYHSSDPLSRRYGLTPASIASAPNSKVPIRLGIPDSLGMGVIDGPVLGELDRVARELRARGKLIEDLSLDWIDEASHMSQIVRDAEARAIHRQEVDTTFVDTVLDERFDAADLAEAYRYRSHAIRRLNRDLDGLDAIILPALPRNIGAIDSRAPSELFRFLRVWNYLGNPAGVVPTNVHPAGGPMGLQVAAQVGRDDLAISAMAQVERLMPPPWSGVEPRSPRCQLEPSTTSLDGLS